jgi:hypothetical protein
VRPPAPNLIYRDRETIVEPRLGLFDHNGAFFTYFNTTFATETFFGIHGHRLTILHLEYFDGTDIHAFFATNAFFFIDNRIKRHYYALLSIDYFEMV